jgi:hypothetical protein
MEVTNSLLRRFWSKVDKRGPSECWPWLGGTDRKGYGLIGIGDKTYRAPRLVLLFTSGEMPDPKKDACHCCDTPSCVNPTHVSECTRKKNMEDAARKGRVKSGKQKLTHAQVLEIRDDPRLNKQIALDYGLNQATVYKIKARIIWKNI